MTEGLVIRPATAADEAAVRACVDAAYAKYVARIGKKPGPMLDDFAALIARGVVFCGEAAGGLVGVLVLETKEDHLLLDNVALLPQAQGKGFGRQLLAFAERYAKEAGFGEIRLYTNEKMTENIALYPRLGYVETGRREDGEYARVFFTKQL
jgi:ribosomal protein S18 acetylase RimI-like enzyme